MLSGIFRTVPNVKWCCCSTAQSDIRPIRFEKRIYMIVGIKMKIYSKAETFKYLFWGLPVSRAFVIFGGIVFVILLSTGDRTSPIYGACLIAFGGLFAWITVIVASFYKCDACGKHPTTITQYGPKPLRRKCSEYEAFKSDFYPFELREKKFKCIHCGTEFSLQRNAKP